MSWNESNELRKPGLSVWNSLRLLVRLRRGERVWLWLEDTGWRVL